LKPIKITCEAKAFVEIDKIESIQGDLKKITPESMKKLKQSIIKHGFSFPVFVWKNKTKYYSIDGVHRVKALKELGAEGYDVPVSVPVAYINARDRKQAKKLLLAVSSQYAKFTEEGFTEFIKDLDLDDISNDIDIPSIDIDSILNAPPETEDDDEIPDEVDPVTKLGDLWELGHHRVLCGDSTKIEDVERLMDGDKADMVFTDPPYGVSVGQKNQFLNTFQKAGMCLKPIEHDDKKPEELKEVLVQAFTNLKNIAQEHCSLYVTAPQGGDLGMMMMMMMKEAGLSVRHVLMWCKNAPTFSMGRLDYDYQHEPILYSWIKKHKFYGNGKQKKSVWNFDKPRKCDLHPTMKPVELIENAILNSSAKNNIVVDVFLGSGSTLIACEKTERVCCGVEFEPIYCDVIVNRYKDWCEKNERTPEIKLNGNPHVMAKDTK